MEDEYVMALYPDFAHAGPGQSVGPGYVKSVIEDVGMGMIAGTVPRIPYPQTRCENRNFALHSSCMRAV